MSVSSLLRRWLFGVSGMRIVSKRKYSMVLCFRNS